MEHWKNKSLLDLTETLLDGSVVVEQWKFIEGTDSKYEISNFGRIKSLYSKQPLIKSYKLDFKKYGRVGIRYSDGTTKTESVHRLVAIYFIPNLENKPQVNHIKGVKLDNRASQLEWSTESENQLHSFRELNRQGGLKGKFGAKHPMSKKVYCATLGISFGSLLEASRDLGMDSRGIGRVCRNTQLHFEGLVFNYV